MDASEFILSAPVVSAWRCRCGVGFGEASFLGAGGAVETSGPPAPRLSVSSPATAVKAEAENRKRKLRELERVS